MVRITVGAMPHRPDRNVNAPVAVDVGSAPVLHAQVTRGGQEHICSISFDFEQRLNSYVWCNCAGRLCGFLGVNRRVGGAGGSSVKLHG